jgi:hypothetical protein
MHITVKFPEPECKIFDKKTAKNLVPLSLLSVLIHVCLHPHSLKRNMPVRYSFLSRDQVSQTSV